MNKSSIRSAFFMFILYAGVQFFTAAHAMGSKGADISNIKQFTAKQSYVWYDGDRKRMVWLNPQLVAEFNPNRENRSALKSVYASAKEIPSNQGTIRLWQLNETVTSKSAIQSLNDSSAASDSKNHYSPVLHDSSASSGYKRALPGNIIVHLDPKWGQAEVDLWLVANSLEVVKKLNIGTNVFVIKTDPGLVSLETANRLYNTSEVVAAYPDWWTEMVTR